MAGLPPIALAEAQAELVIDLVALSHNWRLMASRIAPAECGAVVKADAYGIGIEQAAPALHRAGCRTFFVAHVSEGIRVRAALANGLAVSFGLFSRNTIFLGDVFADVLAFWRHARVQFKGLKVQGGRDLRAETR